MIHKNKTKRSNYNLYCAVVACFGTLKKAAYSCLK